MSTLSVSYLILWVLVCMLLIAVVALYSAFGVLYRSSAQTIGAPLQANMFGPSRGDIIDVPELTDLHGEPLDDGIKRWLFTSTTCRACTDTKAALRQLSREELTGTTALVCRGERAEVLAWASDLPEWVSVVMDEDGQVSDAFSVHATPLYVGLDDARHCLVAGPASTQSAIEHFEEVVAATQHKVAALA